jgi:oxygen-independent coproporphyrinogen-3 oxidase
MKTPTTAAVAPACSGLAQAAKSLRAPRFPTIDDALLARLDRPAPRYTSYPTAPYWTDAFGPAQAAQAIEQAALEKDEPLSLYVHVPFCREMCTYCGCNVVVSKDPERAERYVDTLIAELRLLGAHLGDRRKLARVHFGGGTPTFLSIAQLERLWRGLTDELVVLPHAEMAIEIDPVATTTAQLDLLASFGFNRISLGVQDFDPEVQRTVRRIQSVEETGRMVEHARARGFKSVNFDLIYGLPRQTHDTWAETLRQVVKLDPDRMAVYSFAFVPDARPNQRVLPVADIPRGRPKLELFAQAYDTFVDAGYRPIGMDHFARPDDELSRASDEGRLWRDFQGFTVWRAADTVGVGTSSISTLSNAIIQDEKHVGQHAQLVAAGTLPVERGIWLSDDDRRRRDAIISIMCNDRVDLGADATTYFAPELERLRALADEGLCSVDGTVVTLTPVGQLFSRNVALVFDTYLATGQKTFSRTV